MTERLLKLKQKLNKLQQSIAEQQGRRTAALEQLEQLGFTDPDAAKARVTELETELEQMKQQLDIEMTSIEQQMEQYATS